MTVRLKADTTHERLGRYIDLAALSDVSKGVLVQIENGGAPRTVIGSMSVAVGELVVGAAAAGVCSATIPTIR